MLELLGNFHFRLVSLAGLVVISAIFGNLKGAGKYVFIYMLILLITEIFNYFYLGYNLIYYSGFGIAEFVVIVQMVVHDIRRKWLLWILIIPPALFVFFYISNWSFVDELNIDRHYKDIYPIDEHQYFDFLSVLYFLIVLVTFKWLYHLISDDFHKDIKRLNTKKVIFIFAFLGFHGGTFFTTAFARVLLPDLSKWDFLWSAIFIPLYFLFTVSLTVGLLWKSPT